MPSLTRTHSMLLIAAAALLGGAWWPVSYNEPTTWGIDAYQYHAPLFGNHTQSQTILAQQPLESIGALLVSLRRSQTVPDVTVTFTAVATNALLQSHTIPGAQLRDDTFTSLDLSPPLPAHALIRVTFSAPEATADTTVGIRFHPDNVYPAGERYFDGQPVAGDLALALRLRLPAWQVLLKSAQHHPTKTMIISKSALIAAVAAALASRLGWARLAAPHRRRLEIALLGFLALATIASRLSALAVLGGVSGGDPYNYLFITDSLSHGENPFATKRLPGYPLLLVPAYLTSFDDIRWMRLVNIASSGGIVFLTGLLARRLKLPWSVQFFALLLLAWQKDFYWLSLRPEAYTVYACLLMASLVMFFSLTTWRRQLLFGILLGYAAMTRQEGFALALFLGIAALVHCAHAAYRTNLAASQPLAKKYLTAFAPALLLVLPFFIHNAITFGNPLYTPYFAGERLNIVDSWPAFADAAGATWGVLGSLWKNSWDQLERLPMNSSLFIGSAIAALAWWAYQQWRLPRQTKTEALLLLLASILLILLSITAYTQATRGFAAVFTVIAAAALLVSPVAVIGRLRWRGVLLLLIAGTQILIATWFHPFPKHYQQDLPLLVLALAVVLIAPTPAPKNLWRSWGARSTYLAIAFAFALATLPLYDHGRFNAQIDEENQNNALDSVIYRAVTAAKKLPGPYGIGQAHLPARLYFQEQGHYYENVEDSSPDLEAAWLRQHKIQTLVTTNLYPVFTNLPATWQVMATYKAEGKNEQLLESFVYTRK